MRLSFTYSNSFGRDNKVVQIRSKYRKFPSNYCEKRRQISRDTRDRICQNTDLKKRFWIAHNRFGDSLDPLGESDEVYRETYGRQYNDFMTKVKCFGNVYKRAKFKIPRIEPNAATSEQVKYVVDTRTAEWNFYKVHTVWLL